MEPHEEVPTNEARGGETPGIARYILVISTVLMIVLFAALLLIWG